jgi:putative GTP pyrophosphokinase
VSVRSDEILATYRRLRPAFERATEVLYERVRSIISDAKVAFFEIDRRTKELDSLEGKLLSKKGEAYTELRELTDLCGVCVVVYFEDDIPHLVSVLESSFTGLTREDLVDKLTVSEADRFGYRAHHLTVSLSENLSELDPKDVEALTGFKGEIQLRTGFMHVWAKIEHKYNYKAKDASPSVKRGFARLASLVELSDRELSTIHQWYLKNGETIISAATVSVLIASSENQWILQSLARENHFVKSVGASELELELTQTLLRLAGFSSIADVKQQLLARQHTVIRAMSRYFLIGADIRPQNPIDFLAFDRVIESRQIAGLVELVQATVPFEDDMELFDYCRLLFASFTD